MKINIPYTRYSIVIRTYKGGTMCNGNGYRNYTLSVSIFKKIGNGDSGIRGPFIANQTKDE